MTAELTRARIEDALARANAATEGPWEVDTNRPFSSDLVGVFVESQRRYAVKFDDDEQPSLPDAEFIAASRSDVPAMAEALIRVLDLHPREVIAVHEGYGEEAWCPCCREHYPCATVRAIQGGIDRG